MPFTGNMNYTSPNSKFTIGVDMKVGFTDNSTGSGNAVSQSGVASGASASSPITATLSLLGFRSGFAGVRRREFNREIQLFRYGEFRLCLAI